MSLGPGGVFEDRDVKSSHLGTELLEGIFGEQGCYMGILGSGGFCMFLPPGEARFSRLAPGDHLKPEQRTAPLNPKP